MEIEAKFRIPDEPTFRRLRAATTLAGFELGQATWLELHDRYLDTPSRDFLAWGYTCRLRRSGDRHLGTLKGLGAATGAVHRRAEHQVALPAPLSPADWPPGDARDLALQLSGNAPLDLLFEIDQIRHSRPLLDGGHIIAELNLDRVRLGRGDTGTRTFLELEVELAPDGTEQDLERLAEALQGEWGLVPESRSKFEKGLALLGAELASLALSHPGPTAPEEAEPRPVKLLAEPGILPDDPMSEAGRKTFRYHFRRMLYHEPGTRQGLDIEALHDMRVATRRMRAAFQVFGDFYEPKAAARHRKGLKQTGRALGAVRDLDVFREKARAYQESLSGTQRDGLDGFLAVLEVQRDRAREAMLAYLNGPRYRRFVERFGKFVETEGLDGLAPAFEDGEPRPHRVRHVAPMVIYERLAAVRAYDEWVTTPDPPLPRLHALRIAGKRLRYSLEFFAEVLGPDTRQPITEVVSLQDHLGALQDAVVASGILRDFLAWGTWGHDAAGEKEPDPHPLAMAPGVASYLAAQQAELQHLVDTFPAAWERITGQGFSRMVAEAIHVL